MRENIVELLCGDKQIYLVKTAHVSKTSIEDVDACFEEVKPDSICIELDEQRYQKLENPEAWRETDIVKIIKDKQVGFLMVNVILSSFQRRMAKSLGSTTGGEMMEGIKLSKEHNLPLVLADRPIKTTFARIWAKLGAKEKFKLLTTIIGSIFDDEEISEEDLAKLKEADALEAALMEVSKEFPTVKQVLVDERDQYLAQKIKTAPGKKIMAIIGAAHAGGIAKHIGDKFGLDNRKSHKHRSHANDRQRAFPEPLNPPADAVQHHGRGDHDKYLGELARLQVHRTDGYPAERTVDRAPAERGEHEKKKNGDDSVRGPCDARYVAPAPVVDHRRRRRDQDTGADVGDLALEEEVRVLGQAYAVRFACAEENDKPQCHESRDNQGQCH